MSMNLRARPLRAAALALSFCLFSPAAQAERIWEEHGMEFRNGDRLWATLDRDSYDGCFKLKIGSESLRVFSTALNCTGSLNGSGAAWTLGACDRHATLRGASIERIFEKVMELCG